MSDTEALVHVEHDAYGVEGAVSVTMNRPAAFNALSESMLDALATELNRIAQSDARVVVIAGAGRAFAQATISRKCARHRRLPTIARFSHAARA